MHNIRPFPLPPPLMTSPLPSPSPDILPPLLPSPPQGSQKLLHWSAERVVQWVRSIELEEYAEGLENLGIHGAVMV